MQNQSATAMLRDELFATLRGLKEGSVTVETANAISKISSNIISTVAVEIQAAEIVGADKVRFINNQDHRAIGGGVIHKLKG